MRMSAYELLDRKLASSVAALKVLETKQEHIQAVTFANGNTMAVNARPVFDENGDIKRCCFQPGAEGHRAFYAKYSA